MFKLVNGRDYSANVIAGTYAINPEEIYTEWTDANHVKHRNVVRERLVGSFDMFFGTVEGYEAFVSDVNANKTNGKVAVQLMSNATGELKTINAFVNFEVVRSRNDDWTDRIERFTVNIEEE